MHNFQSNRDLERKLGSLAKVKHIKTETTLKEAKKKTTFDWTTQNESKSSVFLQAR